MWDEFNEDVKSFSRSVHFQSFWRNELERYFLMMNSERYSAIVHPIFHRTKVTKMRLVKCLIVLWHFVLALTVLRFYRPDVLIKFVTLKCRFLWLRLFLFTLEIYFASARSSKNCWRRNRSNTSPKDQDDFQTERRDNIHNLKLVKSCFIVVVCFGICFLHGARLFNCQFSRDERRSLHDPWLVSNIACIKF